jgi:subtilisin-like proprotein convertase family protein
VLAILRGFAPAADGADRAAPVKERPMRDMPRRLGVSLPVVAALVLVFQPGRTATGSLEPRTVFTPPVQQFAVGARPIVGHAVAMGVSAPARSLALQASPAGDRAASSLSVMAPPVVNVEGISNQDNFTILGTQPNPPNANGDVGPSHYVQQVNTLIRIHDKSGTPVLGPFRMRQLFAPIGGVCALDDRGDPTVLYDPLADRWVLSQIGFAPDRFTPPYHLCLAVSSGPDPTGWYWVYDFEMPGTNFPSRSHFGVWSDGYYLAVNQLLNGHGFNAAGVYAFDRATMVAGTAVPSYVYFDLSKYPFDGQRLRNLLPADLDGRWPPPEGAPNVFACLVADEFGDPQDGLRLFDFHADFATPANSTFVERSESPIAVASFDPLAPNGLKNVPQPPPASPDYYLDAASDRLMYRLQYRNNHGTDWLVTNHTVDIDPTAAFRGAIRYYHLKTTAGAYVVAEQATYSPDTDSRWMGSAAADRQGNLAVGFNVSGYSTYPSIRYAGRLASDPAGGLHQGEATIVAGSGLQLTTSSGWGEHSMLAVDPTDECTFWYTSEYYTAAGQSSGPVRWQTRIASFKFPSCSAPLSPGTIQGTVRSQLTGLPIDRAIVRTPEGYLRATGPDGTYSMGVRAGAYTVGASANGYAPASVDLDVPSGGIVTQDFTLGGMPILSLSDAYVSDAECNGNGEVDVDECLVAAIELGNSGTVPATAVSITASITTPGVTMTRATSPVGTIPPGGSVWSQVPLEFVTAPTMVPGAPLTGTIDVYTAEGPFTFPIDGETAIAGGPLAPFEASGPLFVPDGSWQGASLDIPVSGVTSAISKLVVQIHVLHTRDSDLIVDLIAPDNTKVTLANGRGGPSGGNFGTSCAAATVFDDAAMLPIAAGNPPFIGSFRPEEPLSDEGEDGAGVGFYGKSGAAVNGTWKLRVIDPVAGNGGSINCATIVINGHVSTGGNCSDVIFTDGFEWGAFAPQSAMARWTAVAGTPFVRTAGALNRAFDIGLSIAGSTPQYVQDDRPDNEGRYRARFLFDTATFDPGEASAHYRTRIFIALAENPIARQFVVVLKRRDGIYSLLVRTRRDDGSRKNSSFFVIGPGVHSVQVDFSRATAPGANDGTMSVWIDDVFRETVTGIDNDQQAIDLVRMGAMSVKAGANGTLYFDKFESRRAQFIAP